ncbi:hypothetical protein Q5P01_019268 [Channa striata]|uniref:Uncharacterized protein n=1 Tax=Channa striata TaxID=64152 RepID=A0AA88M0Y2_CHASR|nr:hypothetical protein Q5P01_019268 [Channa striata]
MTYEEASEEAKEEVTTASTKKSYGLLLLTETSGSQWVIETRDDGVSRPADRNKTQEPCYDKHRASSDTIIGFAPQIVTAEAGAVGPNHSEPNGQHRNSNGDTDQGSGDLQFLR